MAGCSEAASLPKQLEGDRLVGGCRSSGVLAMRDMVRMSSSNAFCEWLGGGRRVRVGVGVRV